MKTNRVALLCVGGLLGGALGAACSDGETKEADILTDVGPASELVEDGVAGDTPAVPATGVGVVDDHYHKPGSRIIELDGTELPALPTNLGDRMFDTVVRLDADGRTQRKLVETTSEQRALTSKMAHDFETFLKDRGAKPTAAQLEDWRSSWGLPSKQESARMLDDLMKMPFDIMLQGDLDERLEVEIEGLGAAGLEVMTNTQALAAFGYAYTNTPNGGSSGGACGPYIWDTDSIVYWSGSSYTGNVVCLYNIWSNGGAHDVYFHWNHASYWPSGEDVDSYIFQLDKLTSRDPEDTIFNRTGASGVWRWDPDSTNDWIDNCPGSCIDPVSVTCW
jgi:hypothetical protein